MHISGDTERERTPLHARNITLNTRECTFWETLNTRGSLYTLAVYTGHERVKAVGGTERERTPPHARNMH